ncbi:MAG: PilZ domain-containing protein [Holophaga sp.]|nr:PilZ domain-containing protein [Holophaga sp.]
MNREELLELVQSARESSAPASVRAVGSVRLLGGLRISGFEPGIAVHLSGAKRRDQLPVKGTPVIVSILLGDEILCIQSHLLDAILADESDTLFPPILRVDWPSSQVEVRTRGDVRVATPDLPPLSAKLEIKDKVYVAKLLNLTETGMGLGLSEKIMVDLHAQVEVETELPGGLRIRTTGNVRHLEWLDDDPAPTRLGIVLGCMTDQAREALRRFIQARRTDRSEHLRSGI